MSDTLLDVSRRVRIIGTRSIDFSDYTDVWKARLEGEPGKVVVRMIRGGSSSDRVWVDNLRKRLIVLGEVWIRLRHRNISGFLGFTFTLQPMPGLVSPFYSRGNITRHLARNPHTSIQRRVELIQGVARAAKYLHYFDPVVVHGAIRGSNVLIDAEGQPILCDYGLVYMSAEPDGSYRWIAPEILDPEKDADPVYTTRSDVYAFAMTMLEIMTGQPPFAGKLKSNVILNVIANKRPQLPPAMVTHENLGALVTECWAQDPKCRLDMYNICLRLESHILGTEVEITAAPST